MLGKPAGPPGPHPNPLAEGEGIEGNLQGDCHGVKTGIAQFFSTGLPAIVDTLP